MLPNGYFYSIFEILKLLINFDYFLEIEFLEVNVHPSDQEINQVTLFELVVS